MKKTRLSRRQFAGAVAAAVAPLLAGQAAPAVVGRALTQEEKKPEAAKPQARPGGQVAPAEEESFLERGRQALMKAEVPVETEPAFVFQANVRSENR